MKKIIFILGFIFLIQFTINVNICKSQWADESADVKQSLTQSRSDGKVINPLFEIEKLKSDSNTVSNSITFQPIGLLLLLTNFEYDRAITTDFSVGAKVSFSVFLIRNVLESQIKDEKGKEILKTFKAFGIGTHFRYYPGSRAVEGFFLGGAIEKLSAKYDEIKSSNHTDPFIGISDSTIHRDASLWRIEFEIGSRNTLSSNPGGVTIQWTLGAGAGFWNDGKKKGVIPLGSIGFGVGYSF